MGFDCGRVDGIYGELTAGAVKEFQKSVGIAVDGKCGPATVIGLIRLTKIVSGGAPSQLRESAERLGIPPASETISGRDATAKSARISLGCMPAARAAKRCSRFCGAPVW